jgi:hypothetical protein
MIDFGRAQPRSLSDSARKLDGEARIQSGIFGICHGSIIVVGICDAQRVAVLRAVVLPFRLLQGLCSAAEWSVGRSKQISKQTTVWDRGSCELQDNR